MSQYYSMDRPRARSITGATSIVMTALALAACKVQQPNAPAFASGTETAVSSMTAPTATTAVDTKSGTKAGSSKQMADTPNVAMLSVNTPPVVVSPTLATPAIIGSTGVTTVGQGSTNATTAPISNAAATTVAAAACGSLTNPAWAASGTLMLSDTICVATKSCPSLLQPAGDTSNSYPAVTSGVQYYVTPRTDGITLPSGSPAAVVAVPVSGAMPTTNNQVYAASCFQ